MGGAAVAAGLGLVMLLLGLAILALYVRSDRTLVDAFPAVLVLFVFMFDAGIAIGRDNGLGTVEALAPRYVTFNLLMFVAFYLSMLHPNARSTAGTATTALRYSFVTAAGSLALVLVVASATRAISQGAAFEAQRRAAQTVLADYQVASDSVIGSYLFPQSPGSPVVRKGGRFLEQQGDSVFADPALVKKLRSNASPRPDAPGTESSGPSQRAPGGDPGLAIWGRDMAHGAGKRLLVGGLVIVPWLIGACLWTARRRVGRTSTS
jgi:hypothetical protein